MLDPGFNPWVGKISWRRKWQSTPVFLPGKSHGRWNLVGYSPWGCKESDTTERLHFHFQATAYKTQTRWRRQAKGQRDCLSQSPTHPGFFFSPSTLQGMWDLSSLTRDLSSSLCRGSMAHQGYSPATAKTSPTDKAFLSIS